MLRRRAFLVRAASRQRISIESQIWRSTCVRVNRNTLRKIDFEPNLVSGYTREALEALLVVYRAIQTQIQPLEQLAYDAVKLSDEFRIVQTIIRPLKAWV